MFDTINFLEYNTQLGMSLTDTGIPVSNKLTAAEHRTHVLDMKVLVSMCSTSRGSLISHVSRQDCQDAL